MEVLTFKCAFKSQEQFFFQILGSRKILIEFYVCVVVFIFWKRVQ
jgi:hypothetical protein